MSRRTENELDARFCLNAAHAPGLSAVTWARANGVHSQSITAWLRRLLPEDVGPEDVGPEPVRLVELVPRAPAPARVNANLFERVGDASIEVPADFDKPHLVRVVRALRACLALDPVDGHFPEKETQLRRPLPQQAPMHRQGAVLRRYRLEAADEKLISPPHCICISSPAREQERRSADA